jgi:hypothetical protein
MAPASRTIAVFAAVGAIVVPLVATLAGSALRSLAPEAGGALAVLHDVRLLLWPMSRLYDAAEASRHWLYLPLATVLSNALIYGAIGAVVAWGRAVPAAFVAAVAVAVAAIAGAHLAFDTGTGAVTVAVAVAVTALIAHRLATRTSRPATRDR